MENVSFSVDDNTGAVTFLVDDTTRAFIEPSSIIRRASHVKPYNPGLRVLFTIARGLFGDTGRVADYTRSWGCKWRVDLTPVNGPMVPGAFDTRDAAIKYEIDWLYKNFL